MDPTADGVSGCQPKPSDENIPNLETQGAPLDHDTLIKPEPESPSPYKEPANGLIDSTGQETNEEMMEEGGSALVPNPSIGANDEIGNFQYETNQGMMKESDSAFVPSQIIGENDELGDFQYDASYFTSFDEFSVSWVPVSAVKLSS